MKTFPGGCHCGNVRYVYEAGLEPAQWPVRRCTCSYCLRYGARYTSHSHSRLAVTVLYASMVQRYEFGTKTAEFFRCARCGVMLLASSLSDGRRIAVLNANTLDDIESLPLQCTDSDFDGETLASRLARRNTNWIPEVSIDYVNA